MEKFITLFHYVAIVQKINNKKTDVSLFFLFIIENSS